MIRLFSIAPIVALALALTGCAGLETAFPLTSAGYKERGIVGAVSGFASGAQAICQTLDGEEIAVALDVSAADLGATDALEKIRAKRRAACVSVGAVGVLADGVVVPLTSPPAAPAE
jgi:hypothetical protein